MFTHFSKSDEADKTFTNEQLDKYLWMKEELKKATAYSEGQKTAAYMVLGEIVNLLNEFSDYIRIIGGWVPTLLYPDGDHIGSIDVDVLLNQLEIKKAES